MTRISILFILFVLTLGCNKTTDQELKLTGVVVDHRNSSGLSDVYVRLQEQVVSGGALNSQFETAGEATSDFSGVYSMDFDRANALVYRVDYEKPGYFDHREELNPDDFRPGEPVSTNITMYTEAEFEVRLVNSNPYDALDQIKFRNLDANFECGCCTNDWVVVNGMDVDTTFSCKMHGDYMLHFTYEIEKATLDTLIVDSVFCPAFQTTPITINY